MCPSSLINWNAHKTAFIVLFFHTSLKIHGTRFGYFSLNPKPRVLGGCKTVSRLFADVKWLVTTGISGVLGAEPPNSPFFFHIYKILGSTNLYFYQTSLTKADFVFLSLPPSSNVAL